MGCMMGVDVGGASTDFSVFDSGTERLFHYRYSFTPDDPLRSIVSGIHYILESEGIDPAAVEHLAHGTTVAINTLIRKRGARMDLVTIKGSKGLMEIGNQKRPSPYDLLKEKPESLIPSELKCEVEERLLHDGSMKIPLNEEDIREVVRSFQEQNVTTTAVYTLFSFTDPAHERWIKEIILEGYPETYVSISSELTSEFREYLRVNTTVLNTYLGSVIKKYVEDFQDNVRESGIAVAPYVTQSNGSITSIAETVEYPIKTTVSGPNASMMDAAYTDRQCSVGEIITFDMGGANADISLIKDGEVQASYERMVEGYPARIPMIDTITVGAGGGSVTAINEDDTLKVGPRGADAAPGPAHYMRGGKSPTVTNVNILLDKLNRHKILGGHMDVDRSPVYDTVQRKISRRSSLNVKGVATGIISAVNSNTVRAIRVVSVECGYDIHEFTLTTFGGADPLHACEVARGFGITRALPPPVLGTPCSLGLLMADTRFDPGQSYVMITTPQNLSEMSRIFLQLAEEGDKVLGNGGTAEKNRTFFCSFDCRYECQNYEITVELLTGEITEEVFLGLVEQFHQEHERSYGYYDKKKSIQMTNYRAGAVGTIDKSDLSGHPMKKNSQIPTPVEARRIRFEGSSEYLDTNIYQHTRLPCGCIVSGLAIIEQTGSISTIPPEWQAYNNPFLNLIVIYHRGEMV